ncbi:MAG: bifunctional folylpolyglutamate synthase/dihydrofolate synthase [Verrucomicrobia bacterium]|nr:bifunctional folylpolyglutamate synthase/dihydrofolate synthase [Verrucomicrobiota bacterium]
MRLLAAALGHPERAVPCLHVAGTNGKGSVSAMLDAILRAAGWRTGLYTSPHLVHLGERVQVDRHPLTEDEIIAYVTELEPIAARLGATDPGDTPAFFELMTAMAFLQFTRKACDVSVIEVGLGGRLDATTVVTPEVAVITSIAMDHCEILGDTLGRIAAEKAGIIKPGRPLVVGRVPPEAEAVIGRIAAERGAPVRWVRRVYGDDLAAYPRTSLEGDYQRWNAATATLAAEALDARWRLAPDVIRAGLAAVEWPGRWQRVRAGGRLVILDSSHNPEGAAVLSSNLARLVAETGRRPVVITGILGAVRARPLLAAIAEHAAEIVLVPPDQPRACSVNELRELIPAAFSGPVRSGRVDQLFPETGVCEAGPPDGVVVVTGSLYLLGEVLTRFRPGYGGR